MSVHSVSFSAQKLAEHLGIRMIGKGDRIVTGLCSFDEPYAGHLTFTQGRDMKQLTAALVDHPCDVFIISEKIKLAEVDDEHTFLPVPDPMTALVNLMPLFYPPHIPASGISPRAEVHPTATIGKNVSIGAFSVVGEGAVIGDGVILHPHVIVYRGATIGAECIVHSNAVIREYCVVGRQSVIQNGAVIGGDGFGYIPDPVLGLRLVPQIGTVVLADRVDVGANSCIDRGALGKTEIGLGSKIDNLVQIGHNVKIGKYSIFCGQTGIAGSSRIGDQVVFGGQTGLSDHCTVCDKARIGAKASILEDITEPGDYAGTPAIPARDWHRQVRIMNRISRSRRRLFHLLDDSE